MGESIVLIGPRCCGKTSTGKEISRILEVPFVDADKVFVEVFESIDSFVAQNGWERFRQYEAKVIERICDTYTGQQIVLTPGGEAVAHNQGNQYREKNRKRLSGFGTVIYLLPTSNLEESARILTERMLNDQQTAGQRPALTDEKDPFEEMLKVVRERHHHYLKAAGGIFYTEGKTVQEVAEEVSIVGR